MPHITCSRHSTHAMITDSDETAEYPVQCHCGRVKAIVECSSKKIVAWDCNCSDCGMRRNVHFVIPSNKLRLNMEESLEDATTLYEWGTKNAKRRFCKTCGILAFYTPRSNANDGVGVTLACVDFGNDPAPQVEIQTFDGKNWEESYKTSNIADESK